jgi:hypothetical protein
LGDTLPNFQLFFIFEKLKGSKGAVLIGMRTTGQVLSPVLSPVLTRPQNQCFQPENQPENLASFQATLENPRTLVETLPDLRFVRALS